MARTFRTLTAALVLAVFGVAGCTVHKQNEAPPLTGPSETGLSLTITVSPDVLAQDGQSQSLVQVQTFNPNGQPQRSVALRAEIVVGGASTDFGTLSARNIVTDANGRASVTYTAPPAPPFTTDIGTVVQVVVTPVGSDFANANPRVATIRLVPPGVVGPPASALRPSFTNTSATVGNATVFSASVSDSAGADATGQVVSYSWSFGDGGTGSGRSVSHTFDAPGTPGVTLTIVDTLGRTATTTQGVTVGQGTIPTANFFISPSSPSVNQTVNFNASGSTVEAGHHIVDYAWNFGDGATGSGALATHAYSADGTYTVTLKVTDDAGRKSGLGSQQVTVGVGGPTATFTFSPSQPGPGQAVNFDASQSKATTGRSITSYAWIFDDGTTGSGVAPTHAFAAGGSYVVRLTVTDNQGQTGTTTSTVNVNTSTPSASYTFTPSSPILNDVISFNASGSTAPSGRTIVSYAWNFGDGTTAGGVTTTHVYTTAGAYTVQLTVTDSVGQTGTTTQTITVTAGGPTSSFTASPNPAIVSQTVSFSAAASTAQTGRTIVSYAWNFGDGTTGTGVSTTHAYGAAGSFTAQLTVTDNAGQTGTSTKAVTVSAAAPDANITTSTTSPIAGQSVNFNGSTSTAPTGRSITSYTWDFGDGTPAATGVSVNHVYAALGSYTATLTVVDTAGASDLAQVTISVSAGTTARITYNPESPTGTAGTPVNVNFDASSSTAASGRSIVSYSWTFTGGALPSSASSLSRTFTAPPAGTTVSFTATLTVTDNAGGTSTVSVTFNVSGT